MYLKLRLEPDSQTLRKFMRAVTTHTSTGSTNKSSASRSQYVLTPSDKEKSMLVLLGGARSQGKLEGR